MGGRAEIRNSYDLELLVNLLISDDQEGFRSPVPHIMKEITLNHKSI